MLKFIKIAAIIIFLAVGLGAWSIYTLNTRQAEVTAAVEPMLRDMASHNWDISAIEKYASSDLMDSISKDSSGFLSILPKLGGIKQNNGVTAFRYFSGINGRKTALIILNIQFDTGPSEVNLNVYKDGDRWLINSLRINSPYFTSLLAAEGRR